jgi:hypothetical protein
VVGLSLSEPTQKENSDSSNKKCLYCGSEIDLHASVCPVCKFHQKRWRNAMVFWDAAAGLITICSSALLFSVESSIKLYDSINWRDAINLNYLHTEIYPHISTIISNNGSGPVFVNEITIYYHKTGNIVFYINKDIQKGEFISITNLSVNTDDSKNLMYLANKDGRPSEDITERAEIWYDRRRHVACYAVFFFDQDAEDIRRMNKSYSTTNEKLVVSDAEANIVYFDVQTGRRITQIFHVLAAYMRSTDEQC